MRDLATPAIAAAFGFLGLAGQHISDRIRTRRAAQRAASKEPK